MLKQETEQFFLLLEKTPSPQSTDFSEWLQSAKAFGDNAPKMAKEALRSGGEGFAEGASLLLRNLGFHVDFDWSDGSLRYRLIDPQHNEELIVPEHPIGSTLTEPAGCSREGLSFEEAERLWKEMRQKHFLRPKI